MLRARARNKNDSAHCAPTAYSRSDFQFLDNEICLGTWSAFCMEDFGLYGFSTQHPSTEICISLFLKANSDRSIIANVLDTNRMAEGNSGGCGVPLEPGSPSEARIQNPAFIRVRQEQSRISPLLEALLAPEQGRKGGRLRSGPASLRKKGRIAMCDSFSL